MDDKTWDKPNRQACGTIRLCLAKDQKYVVMKETKAKDLWGTGRKIVQKEEDKKSRMLQQPVLPILMRIQHLLYQLISSGPRPTSVSQQWVSSHIRQSVVGLVPHPLISSGPHISQSVDDISSGPHISQSVDDISSGPHISQSSTFGVFWRFRADLLSLYISGSPFRKCTYFNQGVQLSRATKTRQKATKKDGEIVASHRGRGIFEHNILPLF
ncbi:hypothetical protein ACLOJK_005886 [Asimina triloba]